MSWQSVSVIGTFQNGRQLGITHSSLLTSGANGSWSDPNLDDVSSSKNESLDHVASHHVSSQNGMSWKSFTDFRDVLHKKLWVAIGNIQANEFNL